MDGSMDVAVPPLKWAGGKRWLVGRAGFKPPAFDRLIEPFLGSAAVFFHLRPSRAILSDRNADLMAFYEALRADHSKVLRHLRRHSKLHSKDHYYYVRASRPRSPFASAAKFLYLNRTCWNGLYRVNQRGEFNVPIGTKDSVILETDQFSKVSSLLRSVELRACDFDTSISVARSGDFIFADPPYTVAHKFNGFVKYNESIFSWNDQLRLRDSLLEADARGAKFMLTNASHESIRDLYKGFAIESVSRAGVIAGSSKARGVFEELIIKNYL